MRPGFSSVIALSTTLATSSGEDAFFIISSNLGAIFSIIREYGELGSLDFLATTTALKKFVPITPGSTKITFIPNDSNSYLIDLLKPSMANFVLTYAEPPGKPPMGTTPELIFTITPD